jgi:Uma2 family endonuclease
LSIVILVIDVGMMDKEETMAVQEQYYTVEEFEQIALERYMPDVVFISRVRQPEPCHETWNPLAPDLAVKVMSPTDEEKAVAVKIANYLAAGTVVWLVWTSERRISVFVPGQPVQHYGLDDVVPGGTVLPDFRLKVRDIFEE